MKKRSIATTVLLKSHLIKFIPLLYLVQHLVKGQLDHLMNELMIEIKQGRKNHYLHEINQRHINSIRPQYTVQQYLIKCD